MAGLENNGDISVSSCCFSRRAIVTGDGDKVSVGAAGVIAMVKLRY